MAFLSRDSSNQKNSNERAFVIQICQRKCNVPIKFNAITQAWVTGNYNFTPYPTHSRYRTNVTGWILIDFNSTFFLSNSFIGSCDRFLASEQQFWRELPMLPLNPTQSEWFWLNWGIDFLGLGQFYESTWLNKRTRLFWKIIRQETFTEKSLIRFQVEDNVVLNLRFVIIYQISSKFK